ncbi:DUF427 domain-containing protein [Paenibacillus radicis (ex Gao et al. 2016)]|uniref:DUF427 domain-containing protein n=1 Tax=Paenibacillus radicis (ex Gao et al. 2016) TaxID=1737354 RepID=A0A917M705_9BACL|nr:DUF427 domain-containing protein [Paenibacillus radicis (ex Gao et al. 2016)]GGG83012.1 hypothetical protein GCM10010918_45710 [Paenibacillus radicis (ex Gao et al. 2016)]
MSDQVVENKPAAEPAIRTVRVLIQPTPRKIRVRFGGETVAESVKALIVHERGHLPVYYFPREDVRFDLLESTDHSTHCPLKGDASYWTIQAGGRISENAAWSYPEAIPESKGLEGYIAFYWDRVDQWFEEEEEVFVHPRDPYKRVDFLASTRHIRVELDGVTVAESRSPVISFETGQPVRYYLPEADVNSEYLLSSDTVTRCPYKGIAAYHSVQVAGTEHKDLIWRYNEPIAAAKAIEGRLSFYNERVQIYVDGELEVVAKSERSVLDSIRLHIA